MADDKTAKDQAAELKKVRRGFLLSLLPKIPLLLRVLFSRILGMSETARYLDLETDMTLTILRSTLSDPKPRSIAKTQAMTLLDPGVKGRIWVAKAVAEVPPERAIRDALVGVIRSTGDAEARAARFRVPDLVPVEAEWTGLRAGVPADAPPPPEDMPEEQKYEAMMRECRNATTVLYFHGGAYYLCDPATHRRLNQRLAEHTGSRVYSVRYRLAPQHPFPAALLDALVSYFTLLYPPPGSMHEAVSPRDIVFGGDSAGGNLALALTQTLLHLRRQNTKIAWFGTRRAAPLPSGITLLSPWLDIVQSMPSWTTNTKWDYLPPPALDAAARAPLPDSTWPTTPPRAHLYVDDALRLHPLVSVHLNPGPNIGTEGPGGGGTGCWKGCPPVWLSCGWEALSDEDRYLVSRLRADGVRVVFEEYEAMPHVFAVVLPKVAQAERCVAGWARFVTAARKDPGAIVSRYTVVKARTLDEVEGDGEALDAFGAREVLEMAYAKVGRDVPAPMPPAGPLAGPRL
ncbi:alpha/beta hydrolase fold-domain-containing protein [Xylaria cf. heliscus]|nr:alpha/beta hydrolase fold-domain-containing protein [Xylaria cf. heliscus]